MQQKELIEKCLSVLIYISLKEQKNYISLKKYVFGLNAGEENQTVTSIMSNVDRIEKDL